MRQSNRTVEEPEHKPTRESNRVVPDEHHDVRQSNRAVEETKLHETRQSNRQQDGKHRAHTERVSNRQPTPEPAEPIIIEISDGNATRRIRNANIYRVGQTVMLRHEPIPNVSRIRCIVTQPDGSHAHPTIISGTALFRPSQAGQHWYEFEARTNTQVATANGIFVAESQR